MYSWYLDQRPYHYSLKKQIMTMWFPTLHFYPWDNTRKAKSNVLCIQTSKSLSEMRNREKNWFCLLTHRSQKKLPFPPLPKEERKTSLFGHKNLWLKLDCLSSISLYPHFCLFHPFVSLRFLWDVLFWSTSSLRILSSLCLIS